MTATISVAFSSLSASEWWPLRCLHNIEFHGIIRRKWFKYCRASNGSESNRIKNLIGPPNFCFFNKWSEQWTTLFYFGMGKGSTKSKSNNSIANGIQANIQIHQTKHVISIHRWAVAAATLTAESATIVVTTTASAVAAAVTYLRTTMSCDYISKPSHCC